MTQEPPGASLSEPVQEGEALSDSDDGSTAVIVAADVSAAVRSAHDPVDRFLYRCLQLLFFLIPVAMAKVLAISTEGHKPMPMPTGSNSASPRQPANASAEEFRVAI